MATGAERYLLGLISGSSLDGLDMAVCRFVIEDRAADRPVRSWSVRAAVTLPYPPPLRARLRASTSLSAHDLSVLEHELGQYVGRAINDWLPRPVEAIGYHGHTHSHFPELGFTRQLGNPATIAALTGLPVIADLRAADIAVGGQGAPLAPVADLHLFPEHRAFLNLGGIANLSYRRDDGDFIAGDITGCCQVLDRLAQQLGQPYDKNGDLARGGRYDEAFATALSAPAYHRLPYPKSLDNGWVREVLWPIVAASPLPDRDKLGTFTRWLAAKIKADMGGVAGEGVKCLVTGGGGHNAFLLDCLGEEYLTPDRQLIDFKEAALIALCALLRLEHLPNSLASATGADHDTVNGSLWV